VTPSTLKTPSAINQWFEIQTDNFFRFLSTNATIAAMTPIVIKVAVLDF
jgi:hypothetical protein